MPEPLDKIRLVIDLAELTWEEWDLIEEASQGKPNFYKLRPIVARHMVDQAGQPIPEGEAFKMLGTLKRDEMVATYGKFLEAVGAARDRAIPPTTGSE
jgi:hypothetical protein